ncbi:MAG: dihydrodipicolinate synthase family protein [Actinobacteria bacterium]|nr:dihydrodipicolinate synthase family protein [Actinomycetota bacterium]MCL5026061.1 dihydrodipicolinate synthase family protein [Chloroflexota bacterium]
MAKKEFKGIVPPILTPLNPDETVDKASMKRLVKYLLDNGVHGIWATGTTGEFAALTDKERIIAIETIVEAVNGRVPIIANVGDAGSKRSAELGLAVKNSGVDAIATTPPYYYPNSQDELLEHFRYVHDKVGLPVFIYNIPPTVKVTVNPDTIVKLAKEGSVVGIKDSSGQGEAFADLVMACDLAGVELIRFLGTRARISTCRAVGAHGDIPSGSNLFPAFAVKAWELGEAGKLKEARKYDDLILKASKIMGLGKGGCANAGTCAGMKSALKIMGILDSDTVTAPLRPYTAEEKAQIPPILKEVGLI